MVVLAASICNKTGKALLSRQFIQMPNARIEGLIASFPKLYSSNDTHSLIETESVRFVYQPLEDLFLILITNKNSNILQDIGTLHLLARLVSEPCRSINEKEILANAFELIILFDEVIASGGYRENVELQDVRVIMEMDSHEERIQDEIDREKEREAKQERERISKQMDQAKRDASKRGPAGFGASQPYTGFKQPSVVQSEPRVYNTQSAISHSKPMVKGMQLGGKKLGADAIVEAIKNDEGLVEGTRGLNLGSSSSGSQERSWSLILSVHVSIEEKISAKVSHDGGLETMEIKGKMELKVTDASKALIRLHLKNAYNETIQFTTHPNVDKSLFATGVLGLKDPNRPFPVGQSLPVLKWRFLTKDDSLLPLSINCWPSPSGNGTTDVNVEYELQSHNLELHNVVISVPYGGVSDPTVHSAAGQEYYIQRGQKTIEWSIPIIEPSNQTGVLEFSVNHEDLDGFFPIKVSFSASSPYCSVDIGEVVNMEENVVAFSQDAILTTEEYLIV